jgi:hypothetical protein
MNRTLPISAAALAAMAGVWVLAWQAPNPSPKLRIAQAQAPANGSGSVANPVTPTPGAPSKTAIPEKIGEPIQPGSRPIDNAGNTGSQDGKTLDLSPNDAKPAAPMPASPEQNRS